LYPTEIINQEQKMEKHSPPNVFHRAAVLLHLFVIGAAALILSGCGKTVTETVPPRVDLKVYPVIGVVEFVGTPAELGPDSTQKFMSRMQSAQRGVRLLELGPLDQVLRAVGHSQLDFQAVRAIGREFGVDAVLSGTVSFSDVRPDIKVSPTLTSISAQAKIDGKMNARLWDAASGATDWTNSSWGNWSVGGITLSETGPTKAGLSTPAEQRDKILMALIKALDRDFWPTHVKRKL
jgi:hypothetical protein